MANNRLVAICMHPDCVEDGEPRQRKTLLKYYPGTGWYFMPEDGNTNFLESHNHSGLWGNYIVFLPEIRGVDRLNREDDSVAAREVIHLLHGGLEGHCDIRPKIE